MRAFGMPEDEPSLEEVLRAGGPEAEALQAEFDAAGVRFRETLRAMWEQPIDIRAAAELQRAGQALHARYSPLEAIRSLSGHRTPDHVPA